MREKKKLIEWLREAASLPLFSQIAAQALFQCKNCNQCCQGEGYALVDREDIKRIALSLGLDEAEAASRFTDPDPEGRRGCRVLKSTGQENSCCFLDSSGHRCRIYKDRPSVCRTFPLLNPDPECNEPICFYPDCVGTAEFMDMLRDHGRDPAVQKEIRRLKKDPRSLEFLRLRLFVWQQMLSGRTDEAERNSSMMNVSPPTLDEKFRRECLAYFLLTVSLEGLEDIDR